MIQRRAPQAPRYAPAACSAGELPRGPASTLRAYRHLSDSSRQAGQLIWAQVLVVGMLVVAFGPAAHAQDGGTPAPEPRQALKPIPLGSPVAPPPANPPKSKVWLPGTGLCGAFRATSVEGTQRYFPLRSADYPGSVNKGLEPFVPTINDFMDNVIGAADSGSISYQTLQTAFDLAGQVVNSGFSNSGDFLSTRGCPPDPPVGPGGCAFPASGPNTAVLPAFSSRFRGFLLVPEGLQGQWMHIGFRTNAAVALRIWPKLPAPAGTLVPYEIISRAAQAGYQDFRVTNSVQLTQPGLYPIEILHANFGGTAILEMAVSYSADFLDIDNAIAGNMLPGMLALSVRGFSPTLPQQFFQRVDGALPFPGAPSQCQQCPRKFANDLNQPPAPDNGCIAGFSCNEAAVCQVCDTDDFCGPDCKHCSDTPATPHCFTDPQNNKSCVQCVTAADCPGGVPCVNNVCQPFCCGTKQYIVAVDGHPELKYCSACLNDTTCPAGQKCDLLNGRCVDTLPACESDTKCGPGSESTKCAAVDCTIASTDDPQAIRRHCSNGHLCVECRYDFECAAGKYCRGGDCASCTEDRHCGPGCGSCGVSYSTDPTTAKTVTTPTDTPFCSSPGGDASGAACVSCLTDAHCGVGGTCTKGVCSPQTCAPACTGGQVCNGTSCVDCITSSQCPCGQCVAGSCSPTCGDSSDCPSNQCCAQEMGKCMDGRCAANLTANPGALCCNASTSFVGGASDKGVPGRSSRPLWALLAALGLLTALRLRSLHATRSVRLPQSPNAPDGDRQ